MAITYTNLLLNPSLEVNPLTGTGIAVGGESRTLSASGVVAGATSLAVAFNGSAANQGVVLFTATALGGSVGPARGAVYVSGTGSIHIVLRANYTDGTSPLGTPSSNVALTETPQRIVAPPLAIDGGKTLDYLRLYIRAANQVAMSFNVDAGIVVRGAVLPDYFDGDSPNAVWTGEPHASTSILTIPDRRVFPVLKIGSPHIGPLRVGKD